MAWKKDFYCGAVISIFCIFNIIYAWVTRPQTSSAKDLPLLAKTEVWLIFWLGVMLVLSIALMVKGYKRRKTEEGQKATRSIFSKMIFLTIAVLILYFIALPRLGFMISTFLMLMVLTNLITWGMGGLSRAKWKKPLLISLIVSVVTVIAIYLLFSLVLNQALPRGLWI
jgi:hypothetical protein